MSLQPIPENIAFRESFDGGMKLGEDVAIGIMEEHKLTYGIQT